MKIAILGTRGIPNNYGGFEQLAEYLSKSLVDLGHDVFVYNAHNHPYQEKLWNGVNIIHCFDPEEKIGTAGQFIYDLNCILDSRKRNFDVILQLGYTSSSIWGKLLPSKPVIITNMDGLEWKRSKFNKLIRKFLHFAEGLAISTSDYLIADSIGIQRYLRNKYNVDSQHIAYGALPFRLANQQALEQYEIEPGEYNMLIARLEPENNIEIILAGVMESDNQRSFLVIGNHETKYGTYLKMKFGDERISFLGGIYDIEALNNLRYFSNIYFHGHSVGGTNPSLLEAMASSALICAHDNEFNKTILGDDAYYFTDKEGILDVLSRRETKLKNKMVSNNFDKIINKYSWDRINKQYADFMESTAD